MLVLPRRNRSRFVYLGQRTAPRNSRVVRTRFKMSGTGGRHDKFQARSKWGGSSSSRSAVSPCFPLKLMFCLRPVINGICPNTHTHALTHTEMRSKMERKNLKRKKSLPEIPTQYESQLGSLYSLYYYILYFLSDVEKKLCSIFLY